MNTAAIVARMCGRVWLPVVLAAWCIVVMYYWGWLASYSYTQGRLRQPPRLDRIDSRLAPRGNSHLLVMALHPKCPCSRSSVGELEKLLSRFRDQLNCAVLIYQPDEAPDDWLHTDLVESVRRLPRTTMFTDQGGRLADQLGMNTSGSTVVYSPEREPKYWGGITAGRGHFGDNPGSDAIAALLRGKQVLVSPQPVFGCQIQTDRCVPED